MSKAKDIKLSVPRILKWADAHLRRHQCWPNEKSGLANPCETPPISWRKIEYSLRFGARGLTSGPGLVKLLEKERGKPKFFYRARLSNRQILNLAKAHHQRTGKWPNKHMGAVTDAPGRTWSAISGVLIVRTMSPRL